MQSNVRKFATTAYALVGTDYIRVTLARVDGSVVFVRADGSNAILPTLPGTFRTSGDIVNVVATLGHRVNMAAVPAVALPKHTWKATFTLDGILDKFACSELKAELVESYTEEESQIAA
jgi:hypothetical protein